MSNRGFLVLRDTRISCAHPANFPAGSLYGGGQRSYSHIGRFSQMGQGLTLAQK